ncbi:DUF3955 domain-containing protein [Priestia taiwanensis]|uniref:DUF3955 domain-containing protein n=1 Tax=Priestia taiwanensis TaxID=1347902 RepID=A0A917AWU4_9BACI|nr:DUF3955 domain-containing protein [Priestia taiwanensis]MBM7364594.1 phosphatidylserine synthase [Priestia taiwanensis]GGE80270.1 hypothetical protein GCM10007140_32260 [Priestia taiwanensis]
MKKKYLFIGIPLLLTIACMISFQLIGSEVAPDGTLVEPFFLLPIGYLFLAISIVSAILIGITSFMKTVKQ